MGLFCRFNYLSLFILAETSLTLNYKVHSVFEKHLECPKSCDLGMVKVSKGNLRRLFKLKGKTAQNVGIYQLLDKKDNLKSIHFD